MPGVNLRGAAVIVTGGGTGIGRELARAFGRCGAAVTCCGRREAPLLETVELLRAEGAEAIAVPTDVTDRASVRAMVQATLGAFGKVDLLFANHGSFRTIGPFWATDPDSWWSDVTANLKGTMLCAREVLPQMMARDSGVLMAMDGGGGADGVNAAGSAYGASKAAVVRFVETLARELQRQGSSVMTFAMNPGLVRSGMTLGIAADPQAQVWQKFVSDRLNSGDCYPPDACARATLRLLQIACPELSGRCFSVKTDWDEVAASIPRIADKNLLVMRLRR